MLSRQTGYFTGLLHEDLKMVEDVIGNSYCEVDTIAQETTQFPIVDVVMVVGSCGGLIHYLVFPI